MDNIYHKEAEFHKMNLQLELKTQALIDEVDTVIKSQEVRHTNRPKTTTLKRQDSCAVLSEDNYSNFEDIDFANSAENNKRNTTLNGIAKFLKMKMLKMQEEVKRLQIEFKRKSVPGVTGVLVELCK
ncbi:uncharacterized protein LOC123300405 [Chrysoperla carnea]|uniref:uncharacterized protein LOC123300405 n=1 Tax=Chrysoperla carnea TaxID=189513 RepID=UPI001D06C450|nr:uncharacterized protein LOC123300405 [Chrysoperla carnea]